MGTRARCAIALGLAVVFLLPAGLAGQNTVGFGVAIVSARFTGDGTEVLDSRTGIGLNGWVAIPVHERFNFVPGVAFVPKGYSLTDSDEESTLKLNYIEFPLLISFPFASQGSPLAFQVFGGPSFAFEVGCTFDFELSGSLIDSDDCGDDDGRKKFDVGAVLGVGGSYPATERVSIYANLGMDLGIINIDEDPDDTVRNRAFFASIGAAIPVAN